MDASTIVSKQMVGLFMVNWVMHSTLPAWHINCVFFWALSLNPDSRSCNALVLNWLLALEAWQLVYSLVALFFFLIRHSQFKQT